MVQCLTLMMRVLRVMTEASFGGAEKLKDAKNMAKKPEPEAIGARKRENALEPNGARTHAACGGGAR